MLLARASGATGGELGCSVRDFPEMPGFGRVTHMIWGVNPPLFARGGLRVPGLVRTGVWGADLLLIVVLGGSFLPGEGSLLSH